MQMLFGCCCGRCCCFVSWLFHFMSFTTINTDFIYDIQAIDWTLFFCAKKWNELSQRDFTVLILNSQYALTKFHFSSYWIASALISINNFPSFFFLFEVMRLNTYTVPNRFESSLIPTDFQIDCRRNQIDFVELWNNDTNFQSNEWRTHARMSRTKTNLLLLFLIIFSFFSLVDMLNLASNARKNCTHMSINKIKIKIRNLINQKEWREKKGTQNHHNDRTIENKVININKISAVFFLLFTFDGPVTRTWIWFVCRWLYQLFIYILAIECVCVLCVVCEI